MVILICILKSILGYFLLMFIGTNLIGLVIRGMKRSYKKDEQGNFQIVEDITSFRSILMTIIFSIVNILYLYGLLYYWNGGIAISGAMLMLTYIPDLLFEMRTGKKINSRNMPKKPIYIVSTAISWGALPLIWYSLCFLK